MSVANVNLKNFDMYHYWITQQGDAKANFDFGPGPLKTNSGLKGPDGNLLSDAEYKVWCLLLLEELWAMEFGGPPLAHYPQPIQAIGAGSLRFGGTPA